MQSMRGNSSRPLRRARRHLFGRGRHGLLPRRRPVELTRGRGHSELSPPPHPGRGGVGIQVGFVGGAPQPHLPPYDVSLYPCVSLSLARSIPPGAGAPQHSGFPEPLCRGGGGPSGTPWRPFKTNQIKPLSSTHVVTFLGHQGQAPRPAAER